jgi:hypothetical protein
MVQLESLPFTPLVDVVEVVAAIATERGARFLEFEQYIQGQRRVYQETLAATKIEGQDDQTDEEVEDVGCEALDNGCDQTFALLEGEYPADQGELSLITRFGYANLLRYVRAGPGAVELVAPAHRNRSGFESLARSGLALAGDRIAEVPTGALLEALTSDELRKVSTTPIPSKARKKKLAVEFLLTQHGIRDRTLEMIRSTNLFYTLPELPELRGLDLDDLRDGLEFAWNATALVVDTYLVAALAPTNRIYEGRHLSAQRFKASNVNDILTCRSCRKLSGTCRPLRDWDRFPFHFGCRCFLLLEV